MNDVFEICGVPKQNGVLIAADHASNKVPDDVDLGISPDFLNDHIAVDIGTSEIAKLMAENSNYLAILGGFSRLVVDLNRYPDEAGVIPVRSDAVEIPRNILSKEARVARIKKYHEPYHARLAKLIHDIKPALVLSLHSFSPKLRSDRQVERRWEVGILYNEYQTASKLALQHLETENLIVGDQLPYSGKDLNATMNRQAEAIGQPYFGVEIRQDLISFENGQRRFADIIQRTCDKVLSGLA